MRRFGGATASAALAARARARAHARGAAGTNALLRHQPHWRTLSTATASSSGTLPPNPLASRPSPEKLAEMNEEVKPLLQGERGGDPLGVIRWAKNTFDGRVAMSTSMGIQAAVLLHMATQVMPNIPVVWVDTGYLPKETYLYAEELRQTLGLNLIVSNNSQWSAARMEAIHGKLWERDDVDAHTLYGKLTKVEPLAAGLASIHPSPLALLSGLRANQTKARANMEPVGFSQGRYKVLPMLRMSDADVVAYMDKYDLPKHPLQAKGYVTVGDWHSSRPVKEGEDARATRFGGKFEECGLHVDSHEQKAPQPQQPQQAQAGPGAAASSSSSSTPPPPTTTTTTTPAPSTSSSASPAAAAAAAAAPAAAPGEEPLLPKGLEALGFVKHHPDTDLAVIMVKKRQEDGSWCRKCNDVAEKMVADDTEKYVSHVAVADVTRADSEGVLLAQRFQVATAPFFLVRTRQEEEHAGQWKPVRAYLQLKKMLQDAAEAVAERRKGEPVHEKPEVLQWRKETDEIRAQIALLQARLAETEKRILDTAALDA